MVTSARGWTCLPIIHHGECRYLGRSRPIRKRRSIPKTTSSRYSKKRSGDDGAQFLEEKCMTIRAKNFLLALLFTSWVSGIATGQTPPSWEQMVAAAKKE